MLPVSSVRMIFINWPAGCNFPAKPVCKQIGAECWVSASASGCLLLRGDVMPTSCYTISAAPPLFPKPTKNFATGQSWVYMGLYQPDCVARHMFMMGFFFCCCSLGTLEQNLAAQPGLEKPSRMLLMGLVGSDQEKQF